MSLKKTAVIIPWSVNNDSRAKRSIHEMSLYCVVDVFYIPKNDFDKDINDSFNKNVVFYPIEPPVENFYYKLIQNTFFQYRYSYFKKHVLSKKTRYDIIYIHDLISGHIGISLKKILKCKLIYDVHDLYLETLNQEFPYNQKGKMKFRHYFLFNVMKVIGKILEKKVVKNSELIFTVNESCANYLKEKYKKQEILYFRNFPFLRNNPQKKTYLSKKLNIEKKDNIILYIGSIAKGRHLINIVKSAKYLDTKNKIIIIGDGSLKGKLLALSKKEKTFSSQIFFSDPIKYNELFEKISEAKIGLMLLDPINKSKEYALANKISEYMLCGIVPFLSNHIEHNKLDPKNEFSIKIDNCEPKAIARAINYFLKDKKLINKKALNARNMFENRYNWEIEKEKFLIPFKELINDCDY